MKVSDEFLERRSGLGFSMFAVRWQPDENKRFNEVACILCHDHPTPGGRGTMPAREVFFVTDPHAPGGTANFRKRETRPGRQVVKIDIPADAKPRKSPALYGLGLLEAVPDATLNALADPADKNGDGISGRRLRIGDRYGRFGWKADHPDLRNFVIDAFLTELGIAPYDPDTNPYSSMDLNQMSVAADYVRTIEAPPVHPNLEQFKRGEIVFNEIGCGSCHTPELKTAAAVFPELANKTIRPYTDMLLHHLGEGDLHSNPEKALPEEFRTPPLWGIGAIGGPYMNDNSAPDLTAAIEKHGGEASAVREKFRKLPDEDKKHLLDFLNHL